MATPQMTLRVEEARLRLWKQACERRETTVSEQIRHLMDEWSTEVLRTAETGGRLELP